MINDNIKRLRKNKGLSQEELATGLHVVRQTVSKWEQGLSVPDAEIVIKMADLLNVSVDKILGVSVADPIDDLAEELAKANELLAEKNNQEKMMALANRVRGSILLLSFVTLFFSLIFRNQTVSICLIGICTLSAAVILYRNLTLLTIISTYDLQVRSLKITTVFDIVILVIGIIFAILTGLNIVRPSDESDKYFALALISCIMIFSGIISPKLPFSKHTGLRLPWTVQDEETWNVAHKIIGHTALPIALLYIAAAITINSFEAVSIAAVLTWIGLPAVISFFFYYQKRRTF